jgi:hypothetical protein
MLPLRKPRVLSKTQPNNHLPQLTNEGKLKQQTDVFLCGELTHTAVYNKKCFKNY